MIVYAHGSICGSLFVSVHAYCSHVYFGQCQCLDNADGMSHMSQTTQKGALITNTNPLDGIYDCEIYNVMAMV